MIATEILSGCGNEDSIRDSIPNGANEINPSPIRLSNA